MDRYIKIEIGIKKEHKKWKKLNKQWLKLIEIESLNMKNI